MATTKSRSTKSYKYAKKSKSKSSYQRTSGTSKTQVSMQSATVNLSALKTPLVVSLHSLVDPSEALAERVAAMDGLYDEFKDADSDCDEYEDALWPDKDWADLRAEPTQWKKSTNFSSHMRKAEGFVEQGEKLASTHESIVDKLDELDDIEPLESTPTQLGASLKSSFQTFGEGAGGFGAREGRKQARSFKDEVEDLRDELDERIDQLTDAGRNVRDAKGKLSEMSSILGTMARDASGTDEGARSEIVGVRNQISGAMGLLDNIGDEASDALPDLTSARDLLDELIEQLEPLIQEWIADAIDEVMERLQSAIDDAVAALTAAIQEALETIKELVQEIKDKVTAFIKTITDALKKIQAFLKGVVDAFVAKLEAKLTYSYNRICLKEDYVHCEDRQQPSGQDDIRLSMAIVQPTGSVKKSYYNLGNYKKDDTSKKKRKLVTFTMNTGSKKIRDLVGQLQLVVVGMWERDTGEDMEDKWDLVVDEVKEIIDGVKVSSGSTFSKEFSKKDSSMKKQLKDLIKYKAGKWHEDDFLGLAVYGHVQRVPSDTFEPTSREGMLQLLLPNAYIAMRESKLSSRSLDQLVDVAEDYRVGGYQIKVASYERTTYTNEETSKDPTQGKGKYYTRFYWCYYN